MQLLKKTSLILLFGLFLTNISFATTNKGNTDFQSTGAAISSIENLQVHLINEDIKTVPVANEYTATIEMVGCCGTCTVTINLGIFSFTYSWCCNPCDEE